jgi:uncharacterized protein YbaR (Trm112 family)
VFIELLDLLRCVRPHEETPLVASFRTVSHRFVKEGTLGCPACGAKYEITGGIADFSLGESVQSCEEQRAASSHRREELATRAGAYLDATRPGGIFVLGGLWAYAAQDLAEMADVRVIAINAPVGVAESERVGLANVGKTIPLASASVQGIALDEWFPNSIVESAMRAVAPMRRLVGPAAFAPPDELTVLAHDDHYWVAEKPGETIPLRRAPRS